MGESYIASSVHMIFENHFGNGQTTHVSIAILMNTIQNKVYMIICNVICNPNQPYLAIKWAVFQLSIVFIWKILLL